MVGSELNCTPGKRGKKNERRMGRIFFEFFSRVLLSERLEQAMLANIALNGHSHTRFSARELKKQG